MIFSRKKLPIIYAVKMRIDLMWLNNMHYGFLKFCENQLSY